MISKDKLKSHNSSLLMQSLFCKTSSAHFHSWGQNKQPTSHRVSHIVLSFNRFHMYLAAELLIDCSISSSNTLPSPEASRCLMVPKSALFSYSMPLILQAVRGRGGVIMLQEQMTHQVAVTSSRDLFLITPYVHP